MRLNIVSIFQYFPDEIPALIGSSESEIVYKALGAGEREPTIEIVEIEKNVNVRENEGWRGSASQNYPVALSPILVLLHSQSKFCIY